jgi:hypothetical protein
MAAQAVTVPVPVSTPTPLLDTEDTAVIERMTRSLDEVREKLDRPLRHHHTLDFMSNKALIVLVTAIAALFVSLWIIHNQRQTIVRSRDNDLKYRYIQMRGEATPADILRLSEVFDFNRNTDSIRAIRRRVERYERLVTEQAEKVEQARLNAKEAERLKNEAEEIKKDRK